MPPKLRSATNRRPRTAVPLPGGRIVRHDNVAAPSFEDSTASSTFITGVSPIGRPRPHTAGSRSAGHSLSKQGLELFHEVPAMAAEELAAEQADLVERDDAAEVIERLQRRPQSAMSVSNTSFGGLTRSASEAPTRPSSALAHRTERVNASAQDAWDAFMDISTREVREAEQRKQQQAERERVEEAARERARRLRLIERQQEKAKNFFARRQESIGGPGSSNIPPPGVGQAGGGLYSTARRTSDSEEATALDVERAKQDAKNARDRLLAKIKADASQPSFVATKRSMGLGPLQKMEFLRKNPEERKAHMDRIKQELLLKKENEHRSIGNIASRNARAVNDQERYFFDARRATAKRRSAQRMDEAKKKRAGLQSWRMARAIDDLQRPEFLRLQRTHATEVELLQNSWLVMMLATSALCEMHDRMLDHFRNTPGQLHRLPKYLAPNMVLQANIQQRNMARLVRASKRIWEFWLAVRPRVRAHRRASAIDLVHRFLVDLGESVKIPIAIKKKLRYVRALQRRFRMVRKVRGLREALGTEQLQRSITSSLEADQQEIKKLRNDHKQFQKEMANKRGIHRVAKNQMIAEHAQQTETQVDFLSTRLRLTSMITVELQAQLVHTAMSKKVTDFGGQAYRYGTALRFYYRDMAQLKSLGLLVDIKSGAVKTSDGVAITADEISIDGAVRRIPVKPVRPYMRSVFTEDELGRIVGQGIDVMKMKEQTQKMMEEEKKLLESSQKKK